MLTTLLIIALLTAMASGALYRACSWLEESSHQLAEYYGLPEVVKGSVLTAIASSLPELATAVLEIPVPGELRAGALCDHRVRHLQHPRHSGVKEHRRVVIRNMNVRPLREWSILAGCVAVILVGVEAFGFMNLLGGSTH